MLFYILTAVIKCFFNFLLCIFNIVLFRIFYIVYNLVKPFHNLGIGSKVDREAFEYRKAICYGNSLVSYLRFSKNYLYIYYSFMVYYESI